MKNLFFLSWVIPFATLIVCFIIVGAVFIAPFFLIGFLLWNRQKNKRKNDIIKLLKNKKARDGFRVANNQQNER
jgi:hypothetical protein